MGREKLTEKNTGPVLSSEATIENTDLIVQWGRPHGNRFSGVLDLQRMDFPYITDKGFCMPKTLSTPPIQWHTHHSANQSKKLALHA